MAGSYHSVALGRNGKSLHVAFVYWDERRPVLPIYERSVGTMTRFNLYYLRFDLKTGKMYAANGAKLNRPLNRRDAEGCLVWDTKGHLSNMPSILVDKDDSPCFFMPVSEKMVDDCRFWFIRRTGDKWTNSPVTQTGSTWNGSHIEFGDDGNLNAFVIGKASNAGHCPYGGGPLQEWRSTDDGDTWQQISDITPQTGLLCNNPRPIEGVEGSPLKRSLVFFGWEGPDGILPGDPFKGRAYLWQDGKWL